MLEGLHYQNAYVCDDIAAGIDVFRGRGLRHEPMVIPVDHTVDTPGGPKRIACRICFIWIDNLQYELIEVIDDQVGMYANCQGSGPLRFHHVCMRVPDWDDFRARVDGQDFPLVMERDLGASQLRFLYLDARAVFGHYLEYTWMSGAQWDQIRAM